ncbi:MAG: hypothetical protein MRY83_09505, partial [Flavobacteriales bacterium]|nr:hypothetical protein [Flavobacteriales bacterium]
VSIVNEERNEVILSYLKQELSDNYFRDWKISRVIWKAGELKIHEASPLIEKFVHSEDEFEQYAAIKVLTDLGYEKANFSIFQVYKNQGVFDKSGRAAIAYFVKLFDIGHSYVREIIDATINGLDEEIANAIRSGDKAKVWEALSNYIHNDGMIPNLFYCLYVVSFREQILREVLVSFLNKMPLKVDTFQSIRYILKMSEIVSDYEFYALMNKRISLSRPAYSGSWTYTDQGYVDVDVEKRKKDTSLAFSGKTKNYLSKDAYKKLVTLSHKDKDLYIQVAKALLCSLDDKLDQEKEEVQYLWDYDWETRRSSTRKLNYPKYASFQSLMYVIYGSSTRFQKSKTKWFYEGEQLSMKDTPREELFPELWDSKGNDVLDVLANSKSDVASMFALKIINDNPAILVNADLGILSKLILHPNPEVTDLIIDTIKNQYLHKQPESILVATLLASKNESAFELGYNWMQQYEADYFSDSSFLTFIIFINNEKLRSKLLEIYKDELQYQTDIDFEQFEELYKSTADHDLDLVSGITELIMGSHLGIKLQDFPAEKIEELLINPLATKRLLAAALSAANKVSTYDLTKDYISYYLEAEEPELRKIGILLLSTYPEEYLRSSAKQIAEYCFSPYDEVRLAIQPTIERLINLDQDFKVSLQSKLLGVIIEPETAPGVHQSSYEVLTKYYGEDLPDLNEADIINLILSKYEFAQKLGTPMFKKRVDLKNLPLIEVSNIAKTDVQEIRESIIAYFKNDTSRINYELEHALRIFNSEWKDVRALAATYFDENIQTENWTVDLILYVCDHTQDDVQAFGRKLVTKLFKEETGVELLLRLQEHPSKSMQFFTTNFLQTQAQDRPEVILKLDHFLKTTLFNINENAATKKRVYQFIKEESIKDQNVAKMAVDILNSVLATSTMKDKDESIDILLNIHEKYPEIKIPVTLKPIEN